MSQIVFKQIPDVISSINIQQCLSLKGRDLKLFLKAKFTGSAWVWLPREWAGAACPSFHLLRLCSCLPSLAVGFSLAGAGQLLMGQGPVT